jgi:sterol desaturase/sphingolipid hydroxylase (fatty acid hydroxylase superfamily)
MNSSARSFTATATRLFLLLASIFWPLERCFPARGDQPLIRGEWVTDLLYFLGQYLIWSSLIVGAATLMDRWMDGIAPHTLRLLIASLPWWLQALLAVGLSDVCIYWVHRLQHRWSWLWRFHAVHHSAEHLDWLAAHREHPVDGLVTQLAINLPVLLLGFPVETLGILVAFRGIWAIYIHSNVRIRLGPLRALIGSPELHHWHHARERSSCNYANVSPLMDLLFGTYRCPPAEPTAIGIEEPFPKGYFRQLLFPLVPRRLGNRLLSPTCVVPGRTTPGHRQED